MHFATPLQAFASTTTPCLEPDLPKFVLCLLVAVFTGIAFEKWRARTRGKDAHDLSHDWPDGHSSPKPKPLRLQAASSPDVLAKYAPGSQSLIDAEFPSLRDVVYADYGGCPPLSSVALQLSTQALAAELTGNPHSAGSWGPGQPDWADALRRRTLEACGVGPGQYTCILTSGATAALKLVGETFPWHQDSSLFCHLTDNHNSVLGVRELAREGGARVVPVRLERSAGGLGVSLPACPSATAGAAPRPASLFAFPMESNFHGVRYGLELVNAVQACAADGEHPAWRVLLDAAKGAGTGPPDLAAHPADFVALSYYKLFGYPTGLGALLVRNDVLPLLRKTYFGGGAVGASAHDAPFHSLRPGAAGFEDGTLPFLAFQPALAGFDAIERMGGWRSVGVHAGALARALATRLAALRHASGRPACLLHGCWPGGSLLALAGDHAPEAPTRDAAQTPTTADTALPVRTSQGPTVTFSMLRGDGGHMGYREVERLASLRGIRLRTGCMCNPGACAQALGLTSREMRANHAEGHVCWDDRDLMHGKPTGAVRASLGYASRTSDVDRIVHFLEEFFVEKAEAPESLRPAPAVPPSSALVVTALTLYPVKSCRGIPATEWPLGPSGLLHDRSWVVVDGTGKPLSPKRCPGLLSIQPRLEWRRGVLVLEWVGGAAQVPGQARLSPEMPLGSGAAGAGSRPEAAGPQARSETLTAWLSAALQQPARLEASVARRRPASKLQSCVPEEGPRVAAGEKAASSETEGATLGGPGGAHSIIALGPPSLHSSVTPNTLPADVRQGMAALPTRFATSGDLLLVTRASLELLSEHAPASAQTSWSTDRRGGWPFAEDSWTEIRAGELGLRVAGACPRCDRICVDPGDGRWVGPEPLLSLAKLRRRRGKVCFGILLDVQQPLLPVDAPANTPALPLLRVGMALECLV
ncbi:Molybdenum cofactor sulfurase [Auxenochlorella protothecoides]|uniref:Molybdenum cofactor sulfurase n=1 Tax=Auxenochlorella protothecoides TaxID=3075 RepID=A0A087SE32_AUXPR|nr:Molybdenum cofactor sulfurase [Auxenochlorella protothecoides]KFM23986.1 Molybdenum cofactor sulfurase [Auxenochlorella protothecoides]